MDLQTYQRKLAGLIKGDYSVCPDEDAHIGQIACSKNLAVTQEIILWWRQLSFERTCVLTSTALKQLGLFDRETKRLVTEWRFSPFAEELAEDFLTTLAQHELEVLASVARFERALIAAQKGNAESVSVAWTSNPYEVLDALVNGGDLNKLRRSGRFTTVVSAGQPSLFKVFAEPTTEQTVESQVRQERV